MPAEHLTPNMIDALRALHEATTEDKVMTANEVGQHLDIRYQSGSYMGQRKVFGRGSAASAVCRALFRRGLVREAFTERYGEGTIGWQITAAGCAKLSELGVPVG